MLLTSSQCPAGGGVDAKPLLKPLHWIITSITIWHLKPTNFKPCPSHSSWLVIWPEIRPPTLSVHSSAATDCSWLFHEFIRNSNSKKSLTHQSKYRLLTSVHHESYFYNDAFGTDEYSCLQKIRTWVPFAPERNIIWRLLCGKTLSSSPGMCCSCSGIIILQISQHKNYHFCRHILPLLLVVVSITRYNKENDQTTYHIHTSTMWVHTELTVHLDG